MLQKGMKDNTYHPAKSRRRKFTSNKCITEKEYAEPGPSGQIRASGKIEPEPEHRGLGFKIVLSCLLFL